MAADVTALLQDALADLRGGRLPAADRACRKVLARHRDHPDALLLLGMAEHRAGRLPQAILSLRRAVSARPDDPGLHNNLGGLLRERGDRPAALACFHRSLALAPDQPAVLRNLALTLLDSADPDAAEPILRHAIRSDPAFAAARADLSGLLLARGVAAVTDGRPVDAEVCLREATVVYPANAEAFTSLGLVLRDRCDWAGAEAAFTGAVRADPGHGLARFNLGAVRLTQGRLREGWPDLIAGGSSGQFDTQFSRPVWNGETLDGGTVLLHADGGLGDAIMYARYVPLVAERARVALAGPPNLARLFGSLAGLAGFCGGLPLPAFARHCPLSRLPLIFGTDTASIPGTMPYLAADPALSAAWRDRVAGLPGLRAGLVWAGNAAYPADKDRSVGIDRLAPLRVPGVSFVSLQKGAAIGFPGIHDWTDQLGDLADTAALIAVLDLVVTVDTAVAHLAGALGKPVWLLNRAATDWRWFLGRDDSPWYPSLRQFRQPAPGDWDTPVAALAADLSVLAAGMRYGLQIESAPDAVPAGPAEHRS